MESSFKTSFGALVQDGGVNFKLWSPTAETVEVVIFENQDKQIATHSLKKGNDGIFEAIIPEAKDGTLYKYKIDRKGPFPDPTSRFQPFGVHGPSQVKNLASFAWKDQTWMSDRQKNLVDMPVSIYELHVGTFTPEGTYKGIIGKLPFLKDLGVTAIELLPLADFPGQWNWGYDGVALYAPARCYGTPEELMEMVNEAHNAGIAVFIDVVYNHFGPDGNYLSCFSPLYFNEQNHTPWGAAVNIDLVTDKKQIATQVRKFFIENSLYWLNYFHFDGLRMDATHELIDKSDVNSHFLKELHDTLNKDGRRITVIAEDSRNLNTVLNKDGYNLDGVWADDFHHVVRVMLNHDNEGYYADFKGTTEELAQTINQGWLYCGQKSSSGEPRGTDATTVPSLKKFVCCIQNHDQIGNRAMGDRLNHQISTESYKVASSLLLFLPHTPMLFQGQEWATTSPFCFFTDHNEELGKLVTAGRRKEFSKFKEFNNPETREKIPDPQAKSTFESSKVKWSEIDQPKHSSILNFYKAMLKLRNSEAIFNQMDRSKTEAVAVSPSTLVVVRKGNSNSDPALVGVFHLQEGQETVSFENIKAIADLKKTPQILFTSEDAAFQSTEKSKEKGVSLSSGNLQLSTPCAVIIKMS